MNKELRLKIKSVFDLVDDLIINDKISELINILDTIDLIGMEPELTYKMILQALPEKTYQWLEENIIVNRSSKERFRLLHKW